MNSMLGMIAGHFAREVVTQVAVPQVKNLVVNAGKILSDFNDVSYLIKRITEIPIASKEIWNKKSA